jgi:uncharacterized protein YjiS (DUF1127 family)
MATRIRFAFIAPKRSTLGLGALLAWSRSAADRARQRRRLAEMSDHQLKDIGISRADAMAEVEKSRWRCILSR